MAEEQKKMAAQMAQELNKLTPEMREKAMIFMQGMVAMAGEKKE